MSGGLCSVSFGMERNFLPAVKRGLWGGANLLVVFVAILFVVGRTVVAWFIGYLPLLVELMEIPPLSFFSSLRKKFIILFFTML